jgi:photosynthetic reaction center cytochrome c subunit
MRPRILGLALALSLVLPAIWFRASLHAADGAPTAPPQSTTGERGPRPPRDPVRMAAMRDSVMNALLEKIKGHENEPAESVFKDVRILKGMPAGRFLRVMNMGFGASLGAGCGFCHVPGKWESEEKKNKQIARAMWDMTQTINNDLLAKVPGLDDDNRVINCTTCHRGETTPALNLPSPAPAH